MLSCSTSCVTLVFDHNRLGPDEGVPTLWRWRLDRSTGTATEEQLDDRGIEFPASTSGSSGGPTGTGGRPR